MTTSDENDVSGSDKDLVMGESPKLSLAVAQNAALLKVVSFQPPMNQIWPAGALHWQKAMQVMRSSPASNSNNVHK